MLRFLSVVILALWVGGLATLGGVAAPAIFAVLSSTDPVAGHALAGAVFGHTFQRFQEIACVCGGLLLALFGARAALGPRPRRLGLRVWTVSGMLAMSLVSLLVLIPRIDALVRESAGSIARLADSDPRRIEFGRLHGLSNALVVAQLVAGLGLIWSETRDV